MHNLNEGATILQHHAQHATAVLPAALPTRIKDESPTSKSFFYSHHSNPMDNAAAAAAAAAAAVGLIDHHHHNRELHHALVASINNSAGAINGSINNVSTAVTAMLKGQTQGQTVNLVNQQQQTAQQNIVNSSGAGVVTGITANNNNNINNNNNNTNNNNNNELSNGQLKLEPIANNQQQQSLQQQQQQQQQSTSLALNVSSSGRSTPSNSGSVDPAPGKLFVGGLSWQTSSEKLKEYFNMFGTVTDVLIMKDPLTQRSRGFGFITFQEPGSVEKVLQVPIHTLDGKKIDPKHATPKNRPRQTNKTKKIFVGGVSQDTSAEEVKAYFSQFGAVEETVMLMDQQTKRHRGFGFVTFENEDIVDRVCEIHFHTIKNKKVECKKAQPKDAVNPAAQLMQKRIMLGTLGMPMPNGAGQLISARTAAGVAGAGINPLSVLPTQAQFQLHAANGAAVAAAAQQAAFMSQNPFQVQNAAAVAANQAAGFGKLLTTYPQQALHSVRYTPYSIPASAAAAAAFVQAQQQHHHQQQQHQQQQQQVVASQQQHSVGQSNQNNALPGTLVAGGTNAVNANSGAHGANAAATHQLAAAAAQQAALVGNNPLSAAATNYQGYTLANVDMSNFSGVDWSSMYGMGMYV